MGERDEHCNSTDIKDERMGERDEHCNEAKSEIIYCKKRKRGTDRAITFVLSWRSNEIEITPAGLLP